jgi:branched-chain amino acid transport system substrate-binding protein
MKREERWVHLKRFVFVLSLVFFLLMGVSGAAFAAGGPAPKTIKIGCSIPLTGMFGAGGKWVKQGYEIGLKHINDGGGVYIEEFKKKIPLEMIFVDNESDPSKSAGRMDKLYSVDKVDVFLGGFAGALLIPQMATAEKYKTPILVTTMTSTAEFQKGYKYIFTPFQSEQDQAIAFLDVIESLPKEQRPTKVAYFGIQDEWGTSTGRYLKEFAAKRNVEISNFEMYAMNSTDFSSHIINAKNSGADALFTTPTPPQGVRFVKQMKEIDWSPKLAFILRAADDSSWPKNLAKDGDYVCHSGGWDFHLKLPGVQKFNEDYKASAGSFPEIPAGVAYACLQILTDALQRAGTLEKDKVRDAIAATNNMMTVMGPMKFKSNGRGEGKYLQVVSQWQNGNDQLVWPKDQASAPLAYPMPPWAKR